MTVASEPTKAQAPPRGAAGKGREGSRAPAVIAISLLVVLWSIPSAGLLINSFRDPQAIRASGWWTVFGDMFDSASWTLQNYTTVLDQGFANPSPTRWR